MCFLAAGSKEMSLRSSLFDGAALIFFGALFDRKYRSTNVSRASRFQAFKRPLRIVEDAVVETKLRRHDVDLSLAVWIGLINDLRFERAGIIPRIPGP